MRFTPHNYQKHCIDKLIKDTHVGLFLDMGLGKTAITLSAIYELKYNRFAICKVLIIAPKKVAEATWQREAAKWDRLGDLRMVTVLGSANKRIQAINTPSDVYIINRENVAWLVDHYKNSWPFDMVIIDESSSFKNGQSKRFKAIKCVLNHIKRMVLLTGTPSPNGLMDLWAQVYLLDRGKRLGPTISTFRKNYFTPGKTINHVVCEYRLDPGADVAILTQIQDICISMKSSDYLDLPPMIYDDVPVVLSPKAKKSYNDLERDMILELLSSEEVITATSAAALSNKLQQVANGAVYDEDHGVHDVHDDKLDAFMELVEKLQGQSMLVFYNFRHDLLRIERALSGKGLRVRRMDNANAERDWNDGKIDILLAHPASTAYGLNLQDGGNHIVWFGLTWSLEQYQQANKRLHRQGQTNPVIIHHLVSLGTRDEDILAALDKKDGAQAYVLESLKARIDKYRR